MPAMTTSAVKTRARTLLNEPVARYYTDDELDAWIDEGVRDISSKTFCTQVIGSAFETTAGVQFYDWVSAVNTTAVHVLHVKTLLDTTNVSLEYVPIDLFGRVSTNRPKFSLWNRQTLFTPTPTAVYTYTPFYIIQSTQTAEGTLSLPTPYHHIVTLYVAALGKQKRRDYGAAEALYNAYNTELGRIYNSLTGDYGPVDDKQKLKDQAPTD